jgi:phosphotransferase system HPr-like phosphotransfer protein
MILSAGLGASLDIEAIGSDEQEAVQAVEEFFLNPQGVEAPSPDDQQDKPQRGH